METTAQLWKRKGYTCCDECQFSRTTRAIIVKGGLHVKPNECGCRKKNAAEEHY